MIATKCFLWATIASLVSAHGMITSPKPRVAGKAMAAACGQQVYSNQASDSYGNIQGMLQVAVSQTDYNAAACEIWLCKGYKAADNTNVQSFSVGQVVPITFDVRAPHTGTANVSVVDTASNSVIGEPLATYSVFASNSATIPANETSFSVTIPDLGGKCTTAGDCVIQHFWNAASINQTYESCIDFTVGGTGSSSGATVSSASVAPVSTSVVISSAAATAKTSSPVGSTTAVPSVVVPTTLATSVIAKVATSSTVPAVSAVPSAADNDDTCEE